jgi:uncharacterized protein
MPGAFEIKQTHNRQFMFNLKAGNGEIILTSRTYNAKAGAQEGIAAVRTNAPIDARYERRQANPGEPYFVVKAADGEVLGRSELYSSVAAMENGMTAVQRAAPDAAVRDLAPDLATTR